MSRDLMIYLLFIKIVIIFGGLFVQINILRTIGLNAYLLVTNQELATDKKKTVNTNGLLLALLINRVDMTCYFNFLILNHFFVIKLRNLIQKSRRPVFLIGHGVRLSNGTKSFIKVLKNQQTRYFFRRFTDGFPL